MIQTTNQIRTRIRFGMRIYNLSKSTYYDCGFASRFQWTVAQTGSFDGKMITNQRICMDLRYPIFRQPQTGHVLGSWPPKLLHEP